MISITLSNQLRRYLDRRNRPAWMILGLCLLVMLLVWYSARANNQHSAEQQFNLHVRDITQAIKNRLRDHEQILLGGAGLFDASQSVERNEWHAFVQRLNLAKNYPGILGVGYSQIVQPGELAAHEAAIRAQGFPNFMVKPAGTRPLYSSIIYLEPFSGRNLAAFGYDMFSQPTRAQAMKLAGETGNTTISGKVKLVQETHGKVQAGFLMYLPIYRPNQPLTTRNERWHALQGFVYSPYRVDDLMHGILGERIPVVDFIIYDGTQERDADLMYTSIEEHPAESGDSFVPEYITQHRIKAYGRTWTIRFQSRPVFEAQFQSAAGRAALGLGGSTAVLLFMLVTFLIFRRERAEEMANKMTEEIRHNQEKLHISEERFDMAVRASNDGIWDWDILAGTYYYSPRFKFLLGLQDTEIANDVDLFAQRLHPEEQYASCNALKEYLIQNETFSVTCRLQNTAGEWRWFRNCGIAVRGPDGKPIRMVGSILDITESKLTERNLQETHAHTQTILDNVVDAIITFDISGNIQSFNRAGETIFGYHANEVLGKNVNLLMPEPCHGQHGGFLNNHENSGEECLLSANREVTGLRKDGMTFPMDLHVSKISHNGKPLFIALVRDITERNKVDRIKNEFVSTVSHELRTPLTSIKGALSLVLSKSADELQPKTLSMLQTASRNCERLSFLINDILDLEKIESGKVQFEIKHIDLVNVARQAVESNESYAQQHAVTLNLNIAVGSAPVLGDEYRLQQVFANLLSNAIKFSPSGASVDIRISRHGQGFRSSIKDYGHGIPQEFHSRIFQRFAQADSSDTRQKGGTGLGLSISKAIIERHNGHIDYHTGEDSGAEFYFDLPESADTAATVSRISDEPRFLICVEEIHTATALATQFTQEGFNTDIAHSICAARDFIANNSYLGILLAPILPDGDGLHLIAELGALVHGQPLPVIIVSLDKPGAHATPLGIADWLQNPVEQHRLKHALHDALEFTTRPRILHVEDDADVIQIMRDLVGGIAEYHFTPTLSEARRKLAGESFDLVILDIGLPDGSGLELLPELDNKTPTILFTGQEPDTARNSQYAKALVKSKLSHEQLLDSIQHAMRR